MTLIKHLKESWKTVKDKRDYLVPVVLIDIVALLFFATIYSKSWIRIMEHLSAIDTFLSEQSANISSIVSNQTALEVFTSNQELFASHYHQILYISVMMFLGFYVVWTLTQGTNWFIADKLARKVKITKKNFLKIYGRYIGKFAWLSLLQMCILILLLALFAKLMISSSESMIPALSQLLTMIFIGLAFFVLLYFTFISYALIPHKGVLRNTLFVGGRKIWIMLKMYIFSIVLFAVLLFLFFVLFKLSLTAALVFVLLIKLPSLLFTRILFVKVVDYHKR